MPAVALRIPLPSLIISVPVVCLKELLGSKVRLQFHILALYLSIRKD